MLLTTPTLTYNRSSDISAVIICKDEAAHIQHALQSLSGRVAQILVLDTGSSDETARICARHGVELHFYEWTNDFAAARNHALQFARHPWILALDADETLSTQSASGTNKSSPADENAEIAKLMRDAGVGAIRVHIKSRLPGAGQSPNQFHTHKYPRLFRNRPEIRYRGAVHEQIGDAVLECGLKIADSDLMILHEGYAAASDEKAARNRAMLERELREKPNDAWLKYHLAQTEFSDGNNAQAAAYFRQAVNSRDLAEEQLSFARLRLGQIALADNKLEEVLQHTQNSIADGQLEGFRKFIRGLVLALNKQHAEALDLLEAAETAASSIVDQEQRKQLISVCREQVD